MITRRDLLVAVLSAAVAFLLTRQFDAAVSRSLEPEPAAYRTRAAIGSARFDRHVGSIVDWNDVAATPTEYGARRRFLRAPTATLSDLEVNLAEIDADKPVQPAHRHVDEELAIVKEGTFEVQVNDLKRRVGPGSVVLQVSNELHGMRNVGETTGSVYVIRWRPQSPPAQ